MTHQSSASICLYICAHTRTRPQLQLLPLRQSQKCSGDKGTRGLPLAFPELALRYAPWTNRICRAKCNACSLCTLQNFTKTLEWNIFCVISHLFNPFFVRTWWRHVWVSSMLFLLMLFCRLFALYHCFCACMCSMHVSAGVSPCGSSRCFGTLHSKAAGNHLKKRRG